MGRSFRRNMPQSLSDAKVKVNKVKTALAESAPGRSLKRLASVFVQKLSAAECKKKKKKKKKKKLLTGAREKNQNQNQKKTP
jgi:hypothetical protein